MGVTYKLKPEIINEIVKKKKETPSISCRQLAQEVSGQFGVKISKSSVNTILKKSQLSSSVGRRTKKEAAAKKFKIPHDKKEQLLANVEKTGLKEEIEEVKEKGSETKEKEQTKQTKENKLVEKEEDIYESAEDKKRKDKKKDGEKDSTDDKENPQWKGDTQINSLKQKRDHGWGKTFDGIGYLPLKSVLSQIGGEEKIISLAERVLGEELDEKHKTACLILVDFWLAGIQNVDKIKEASNHVIWAVYGVEIGPMISLIGELIDKLKDLEVGANTYWTFVREIEKEFINVQGVKVYFDDQSAWMSDALLSALALNEGRILSNQLITRAVEVLSKELISNNEPICMYHKLIDNNNLEKYYRWIKLLGSDEFLPIRKVELLDTDNRSLASFTAIPAKKRDIMVGIGPECRDFAVWTKSAKWAVKEPFYDIVSNQEINVCETAFGVDSTDIPLKNMKIRAVSVFVEDDSAPRLVVLTTNVSLTMRSIVEKYIEKFPLTCCDDSQSQQDTGRNSAFLEEELLNDNNREDFNVMALVDFCVQKIWIYFGEKYCDAEENKSSITDFISNDCRKSGAFQMLHGTVLVRIAPNQKFLESFAGVHPIFTPTESLKKVILTKK